MTECKLDEGKPPEVASHTTWRGTSDASWTWVGILMQLFRPVMGSVCANEGNASLVGGSESNLGPYEFCTYDWASWCCQCTWTLADNYKPHTHIHTFVCYWINCSRLTPWHPTVSTYIRYIYNLIDILSTRDVCIHRTANITGFRKHHVSLNETPVMKLNVNKIPCVSFGIENVVLSDWSEQKKPRNVIDSHAREVKLMIVGT